MGDEDSEASASDLSLFRTFIDLMRIDTQKDTMSESEFMNVAMIVYANNKNSLNRLIMQNEMKVSGTKKSSSKYVRSFHYKGH